jgi:signal transduction histidine kinase
MPAEMEGKLFESFASHGKVNGTGLGLAMAKKIVDAHCGAIRCASKPGQGVTFRIELPL